MKTIHGLFLYSYLFFKVAKMPCFSYYLSCFFFYEIGKQEPFCPDMRGGGEVAQIIYSHVSKCKNDKIFKKVNLTICLFSNPIKLLLVDGCKSRIFSLVRRDGFLTVMSPP
jgi:hypothetical protein